MQVYLTLRVQSYYILQEVSLMAISVIILKLINIFNGV